MVWGFSGRLVLTLGKFPFSDGFRAQFLYRMSNVLVADENLKETSRGKASEVRTQDHPVQPLICVTVKRTCYTQRKVISNDALYS